MKSNRFAIKKVASKTRSYNHHPTSVQNRVVQQQQNTRPLLDQQGGQNHSDNQYNNPPRNSQCQYTTNCFTPGVSVDNYHTGFTDQGFYTQLQNELASQPPQQSSQQLYQNPYHVDLPTADFDTIDPDNLYHTGLPGTVLDTIPSGDIRLEDFGIEDCLNAMLNRPSSLVNTPATATSTSVHVLQPEDRLGDLEQELAAAAATTTQRPVTSVGKRIPIKASAKRMPEPMKASAKRMPDPVQDGCDSENDDNDDDIRPDDSASNVSVNVSNRGREVDSPVGGLAAAAAAEEETGQRRQKRSKHHGHRRRRSRSSSSSSASSRGSSGSESRVSVARSASRAPSKVQEKTVSQKRRRTDTPEPSRGDTRTEKKKRSRSRSASRSPARTTTDSWNSAEKRQTKHTKTADTPKSKAKRSRSRSLSRNRSPMSHSSGSRPGERRNNDSESMPPPIPGRVQSTRGLGKRDTACRILSTDEISPLPPDPGYVNEVYAKVMHEVSRTQRSVVAESVVSRSTTAAKSTMTTQRQRGGQQQRRSNNQQQQQQQPADVDGLMKLLPSELWDVDVAKRTVQLIVRSYPPNSKNNLIADAVGLIQCFHAEEMSSEESAALPDNYPKIDTRGYLFSAMKVGVFGFDLEAIRKDEKRKVYTLMHALSPKHNWQTENSLDLVFRQSLKELCMEVDEYDEQGEISVNNPIFLSGYYLELMLIQKIRSFYRKLLDEDIVEFLTSPCPRESSKLKNLVSGSVCEMYVRKLHERYKLTVDSYDRVFADCMLQRMRVWTNRKQQSQTNLAIHNHLTSVYGEEKWKNVRDFAERYAKCMRPFIQTHNTFLSETLKASELMAWVCFGITMNDSASGSLNMALSFYSCKDKALDTTWRGVCWNYPLANHYRHQSTTALIRPLVSESFWADVEEMTLKESEETQQGEQRQQHEPGYGRIDTISYGGHPMNDATNTILQSPVHHHHPMAVAKPIPILGEGGAVTGGGGGGGVYHRSNTGTQNVHTMFRAITPSSSSSNYHE